MRYVWIPRLMERIRASTSESGQATATATATAFAPPAAAGSYQYWADPNLVPETSATSSGSMELQDCLNIPDSSSTELSELKQYDPTSGQYCCSTSGSGFYEYSSEIKGGSEQMESCNDWSTPGGDLVENLWNEENIWFLQQQLNSDV